MGTSYKEFCRDANNLDEGFLSTPYYGISREEDDELEITKKYTRECCNSKVKLSKECLKRGQNIKEALEKNGITQAELAERVGTYDSAICKYVNRGIKKEWRYKYYLSEINKIVKEREDGKR